MEERGENIIKDLLRKWFSPNAKQTDERQLDQLAADDPFLSEALEGYRNFPEGDHSAKIDRIKGRLKGKSKKDDRKTILYIYRLAAAVAILVVAIAGFQYLNSGFLAPDMARNEAPAGNAAEGESAKLSNEPVTAIPKSEVPQISDQGGGYTAEVNADQLTISQPTTSKSESFTNALPVPDTNLSESDNEVLALKDEQYEQSEELPDPVIEAEQKEKQALAAEEVEDISKPRAVPLPSFSQTGSPRLISGKITDRAGNVLDGVNVHVPGTSQSVITDNQGNYSMLLIPGEAGQIIEAEREGYTRQLNSIIGVDTVNFILDQMSNPFLADSAVNPPQAYKNEKDYILHTISGKVKDPYGEALIGVSVIQKGTNIGTVTDFDGAFQLNVDPEAQYLYFSYIGYSEKEVPIQGVDQINVILDEDNIALNEVTVTGYNIDQATGKKRSEKAKLPLAQPLDGLNKYKRYIRKNLKYPPTAETNNIEGTVIINFTVLSDGTTANFRVKQSLGFGCDEEAIRLLKEGPKWEVRYGQAPLETSYPIEFKQ